MATVRHVDEIEWTEVQRQRNADGSVSVIREKWPIIRPGFLSAHVCYEPGMVVRRHGHRSNHVVFVLGGAGRLGEVEAASGTHVHVPLGAAFGPIVAGPAGLTCWELSFGEFGGWGDRPELYAEEIARLGVTPLPDPPLDLGDWFVDPRGDWGRERSSPKVDGMAEVIVRLGDLPWEPAAAGPGDQGITRIRRAVGLDTFSSTYVRIGPEASLGSRCGGHHLIYVVAGTGSCGDQPCAAGTHIEVPAGESVDRLVAGPGGLELLEVIDGDQRSAITPGDP